MESLSLNDIFLIIQTAAITLAGVVAVCALSSSAKSSRHRATIELILAQTTNPQLKQAKQILSQLRQDGKKTSKITELACLKDDPSEQHVLEKQAVLDVLNNHEFIALGIREKALDEEVYKRAYYSAIMRDWKATQAFITEIRRQTDSPTLFQEFERLHSCWEKSPLKKG